MTKYLDEYDTNARHLSNKVQSDPRKLKFNNIQSCIAVVLLPVGGGTLTGVHLTTITTNSKAELTRVMGELRAAVGPGACDAYVVSTWSNHASTDLKKELKKIARTLYGCDVPAPAGGGAADVDVKFELAGGRMTAYVRQHVVTLRAAGGGAIVNPNYNRATAAPGKPMYLTDRDDPNKQWMAASFRQMH
jgi:hypothetical protein